MRDVTSDTPYEPRGWPSSPVTTAIRLAFALRKQRSGRDRHPVARYGVFLVCREAWSA